MKAEKPVFSEKLRPNTGITDSIGDKVDNRKGDLNQIKEHLEIHWIAVQSKWPAVYFSDINPEVTNSQLEIPLIGVENKQ